MRKGIFITLEGGEGAGKTTIIERMKKELTANGENIEVTREPGGIEIAEKIRELILNPEHDMDGRTEALLYAAARREHLEKKVVPALLSGKTVICDRFIDSSLAYQGYARGLGIEEIFQLNQFAVGKWMPDVTFYIDIPPELGLNRIRQDKQREINRLDLETLEFHHNVRRGYQALLDRFPERMICIDGSRSVEDVWQEVHVHLKERLIKKD